MPVLNLGGGLGARYLPTDPVMDVAEYARVLRDAVGERTVMVEPGRAIAGAAGITLYRVGTVKQSGDRATYVAVDGGMSDNPRPVLYGAGYEAYLPAQIDAPRPLVASIAGKHCEQGDVIVVDAHLPGLGHRGRPARDPGDGRIRLFDGEQLQQGAAAGDGVRTGRAGPGGHRPREPRRLAASGPSMNVALTPRRRARLERVRTGADSMAEDVVRVGLLGCGHVGSALVRLITENGDEIESRRRGPVGGGQGRGAQLVARA